MNTYIWKSIKCKQTTDCKQIADFKQTADCKQTDDCNQLHMITNEYLHMKIYQV